jgi:hypothetical protein
MSTPSSPIPIPITSKLECPGAPVKNPPTANDLSFGFDFLGNVVLFIEEVHFSEDRSTVDESHNMIHNMGAFRVLREGVQTRLHGKVSAQGIVVWS